MCVMDCTLLESLARTNLGTNPAMQIVKSKNSLLHQAPISLIMCHYLTCLIFNASDLQCKVPEMQPDTQTIPHTSCVTAGLHSCF